ncbi:MAG: ArsR/SmtB family transcription factor [Halioglobus sp.]
MMKTYNDELITMNLEEMAEHADEAVQLLKALSNRNRLMVLCSLSEGELSVGELLERVPLSQSALSQHLAVLRRDELVTTRRSAQTVFYSLKNENVVRVVSLLHKMYCAPTKSRTK